MRQHKTIQRTKENERHGATQSAYRGIEQSLPGKRPAQHGMMTPQPQQGCPKHHAHGRGQGTEHGFANPVPAKEYTLNSLQAKDGQQPTHP